MNRRSFLKSAGIGIGATVGLGGALYGYGRYEATWLHVVEQTITVSNLPPSFSGLRVALLTDPHLGPFNTADYIAHAVDTVNELNADLIAVCGDYVHSRERSKYIDPCFQELGRLKAPLGVFGVPGNHDHWAGVRHVRSAMSSAGIHDVTNSGAWVERSAHRLLIAGIDDMTSGKPNISRALESSNADDCCLLLSHNPDIAETLGYKRVGLILSGHMHGGQVVLPGLGYHFLPSRYGDKYVAGLVQGPSVPVFVSRGVGSIGLPIRIRCRPEVNLLTLIGPARSSG